ncbi:1-pyrroline-5-carboxylate dehydrogenase [Caulifigura coniformis]|uniref:L-glutamate gamma-semialdehyde dehydrogenase n=1 Tax=Caulifigura coniformis TaxID=2527983 RepID=A0A517S9Q9_9PLAN|nr:L-glutamate gamma-semialdehyde dehydrogenase [Caulifigura coniformis]QDT52865.1 1-pyrroline-5-carboxylate dehydrogenase [Caulifigura coniformis]
MASRKKTETSTTSSRKAPIPAEQRSDADQQATIAAGLAPTFESNRPTIFFNEPLADFSQDEQLEAMQEALQLVEDSLGEEYPLLINGKLIETRAKLTSRNPSHKKQVVGTSGSATKDHAVQAVEAAKRAFKSWSRMDPSLRAEYLEVIASEMRGRRYELAAWEVYECGKPWADADADVAEAIDFCMYYADQMRQLTQPLNADVDGEENSYHYRARGVAVVIAPWNFPLAILCGMTAAAMVTGNTVVMKPAEQSPVIAAKFMQIIRDAGVPDGVVNFLPGVGEDVGPVLVNHPDVDIIAFTGSRAVGLQINESAARTTPEQHSVRRVISEMGGKNAIIVDDDADLDEAVVGVIHSAFGYAGQKCSACSRVIVLEPIYDRFIDRLKEATESLVVAAVENPAAWMGPVIDEESLNRINDYIAIGNEEAKPLVAKEVGKLAGEGYFVGPHIFTDVDPGSRLAQHEIFGPVLAVMKVKTFEEALDIANNTEYALTGGVFSRSPQRLAKARAEMQVGNLYLNRGITGAVVQRHPFGGYKMSGIGSKAGGRDYLTQFMIPVSVCENTLRRGFAPSTDEAPAE